MASAMYNKMKAEAFKKSVDFVNDTIKAILVSPSYTFNPDHKFASDLSNELSGTGYASGFGGAGRKSLASKAVTQNDTNDRGEFDAADTTWSGINAGTIGGIVLCREVTNDADSPIYAFLDPADTVTNGGDITVQWASNGLMNFT